MWADESRSCAQPCETHRETLALGDGQGHDSINWRVTDDWPEQVPITSAEVDTIEAFRREAINDLLK